MEKSQDNFKRNRPKLTYVSQLFSILYFLGLNFDKTLKSMEVNKEEWEKDGNSKCQTNNFNTNHTCKKLNFVEYTGNYLDTYEYIYIFFFWHECYF